MDMDIAKAGWLHRQSSVLHRWKRNWFVLRTNGELLYFDSPDHPKAEERIVVRARVHRIKPGFELNSVTPPDGMSRGSLFSLDMRDEEMVLCAESSDDMRAWQIALEEARVSGQRSMSAPPGYTTVVTQNGAPYTQVYTNGNGYPGQVLSYPGQGYPPGTVIYNPDGSTTVVRNQASNIVYVNGYPRRRYYDGTDMAMGVVAGAALGSMMWGPVFWW